MPGPEQAKTPFPATVVIIPAVSTFRTRALLKSAMYTFPAAFTSTSYGLIRALVAGWLAPL